LIMTYTRRFNLMAAQQNSIEHVLSTGIIGLEYNRIGDMFLKSNRYLNRMERTLLCSQ